MSEGKYQIGDILYCDLNGLALGSTATEGYFIGHLRADTKNRVLILATAAEVGIEIDAEHCRAIGRSNPSQGNEYRDRYARQHPGRLRSNA
jgi:hypothetical protein